MTVWGIQLHRINRRDLIEAVLFALLAMGAFVFLSKLPSLLSPSLAAITLSPAEITALSLCSGVGFLMDKAGLAMAKGPKHLALFGAITAVTWVISVAIGNAIF